MHERRALAQALRPMRFFQPETWEEALAVKAQEPQGMVIQGGTDVLVELNFRRRKPDATIDLSRIDMLKGWECSPHGSTLRLGAAVTYARMIAELSEMVPALAVAARTVGSPQIRSRGTVGGNIATASPAGDALPPLLATTAEVEVESVRGSRCVSISDFFLGPKKTVLAPDELIRAVRVPIVRGAQDFAKIGPRNAMVIAVCSFALVVDLAGRRVGIGVGSAGPCPLSAPTAAAYLEDILSEAGWWAEPKALDHRVIEEFGRHVAHAAQPIDDVRGSAAYRRHGLSVLAKRTLERTTQRLADNERTGSGAPGAND